MKKLILVAALSAAFSVNAAELGLAAGKNKSLDENVYALSLGTTLAGLKVSTEVGVAKDTFTSVGVSVGREMRVWKFGVTPYLGGGYIQSDIKGRESGGVATTGVEVSYPLSKSLALVGDYTYSWDVQKKTDFQGGLLTAGVRFSF